MSLLHRRARVRRAELKGKGKIANGKFQIANEFQKRKFQTATLELRSIEHWILFEICLLLFGGLTSTL
jgi:hypothetical protein